MPGAAGPALARTKTAGPNNNGVSPPEGSTILGLDGEAHEVATAHSQKCLYEHSLLINDSIFAVITKMVEKSGTLKAGLAFRLAILERRAGERAYTSAFFAPVWALVQEYAAM
jgi:hypothetical protein